MQAAYDYLAYRATVRELSELDAATLADLGIHRSGIRAARRGRQSTANNKVRVSLSSSLGHPEMAAAPLLLPGVVAQNNGTNSRSKQLRKALLLLPGPNVMERRRYSSSQAPPFSFSRAPSFYIHLDGLAALLLPFPGSQKEPSCPAIPEKTTEGHSRRGRVGFRRPGRLSCRPHAHSQSPGRGRRGARFHGRRARHPRMGGR